MHLRAFVARIRQSGQLVEVERPVDPRLEMARLIAALDGRPVLFRALAGFPGWRAISGVCAQRQHFAAALGCAVPDLIHRMAEALAHPRQPEVVATGPCQEVVEPEVDLTRLPILRHHPQDGGPYVTSGVAVIQDPNLGRNLSFHRLLRLDERRFVARIVEGRGTHTALSKVAGDRSAERGSTEPSSRAQAEWLAEVSRRSLPVAIAVGCPVQVLLAAAMSPPRGVDELGIANGLAPTPLVRCRTVDLEVPAQAELVLEGRITHQLADEGPFPDLTGTMDFVRRQPVIEVDYITHRRDPIYHALLPGGLEHQLLMGLPREPTIFAAVNRVCRCTGVHVTPGGCSWLHAVVQIEKQHQEDGRQAIEAAFRGHSSLKHVVVVDTDVDPFDPAEVEWAVATRFQADRDLVVLADQPGSSLDPSGRQAPGQKARTAKMGLDATAPLGAARAGYERVRYGPPASLVR